MPTITIKQIVRAIQNKPTGGGAGVTSHDQLAGVLADQHHPQAHTHAGGSGDMTKAIYDSDQDGKIANAQLTSGTDITSAISLKHAQAHTHPESEVTGLVTDLSEKETPTGAQTKVDTHAALIVTHGMGGKCLTSNFTTSSVTAVSTNLAFAIAPSEVFSIDIYGTCSKATTNTGLKFAINAPTGCTVQGFQLGGGATLAAALVPSLITTINTLGTTLATGIGIRVAFALHFIVVNGSNAGSITLQTATVTSNIATIYAGTKMNWQRITQV